jgi:hypothetical protein
MGCYICAYQKTETPKRPAPLPPTSPAQPFWSLGTCARCSVWACSAHAYYSGRYVCAMCAPASATTRALSGGGSGGAAAIARLVGEEASGEQVERTASAIQRIVADQRRPPDTRAFDSHGEGETAPNVVWDLAGAWRAQTQREARFVREVRGARGSLFPRVGGISIDAVAADARDVFESFQAEPAEDAALVVTGALVIATTVAHDPDATGEQGEHARIAPAEIELRPPWAMSHPVLLDPVMWVVAAAYSLDAVTE